MARLGARPSRPPQPRGWHSRGYVPHLDTPGLIQAVTFRLADSLPKQVWAVLAERPEEEERRTLVERELDRGLGSCLLADPMNAAMVENAFLHFDGERYRLLAWVVMPNHVHVLVETREGWSVGNLVHSWKSFTANRISARRGRRGRVWQPDYFDRFIRDDRHLAAAILYMEQNPVKAGLVAKAEEWPYSSARLR